MKKMLLANDLKNYFTDKNSFIHRADIAIFTAASNDEMLEIHKWEAVDLIITRPDLPGIDFEKFLGIVRDSKEVRPVSTIVICKDSPVLMEFYQQCGADAIFPLPVDATALHQTVQRYFRISPRKLDRSTIAVSIKGSIRNSPCTFWSENISPGGMLIKSETPLSMGDGITFSFKLPGGPRVNGFGEIARGAQFHSKADTFLYGIRFIGIHPTSKKAIEDCVKNNTHDFLLFYT